MIILALVIATILTMPLMNSYRRWEEQWKTADWSDF